MVGLYCDFLAQQEQSTANILGAIFKELARRYGISEQLREAFKAKGEFGGRGLLFHRMVDILKETIPSFPTCRPHIEKEILKYFSQAVRIPLSPSGGDNKSYLGMRLDHDSDPDAMDDELRADIMRIILVKAAEM